MSVNTESGALLTSDGQARLVGMAFLSALYDGESTSYRDLLGSVLARLLEGWASPKSLEEIAAGVAELLGLHLPRESIQYALEAPKVRHLVKELAGQYRFVGKRVDEWQEQRAEIARVERNLIEDLVAFAKSTVGADWSESDARAALQYVVESRAPRIGSGRDTAPTTGEIPKYAPLHAVVAATWAEKVLAADPIRAQFIRRLVEGRIVAAGIIDARRDAHSARFRKTTILLDTPEVLGGLGYHDNSESIAIRRAMSAAIAAGAVVGVLESTVNEVKNVILAARWSPDLERGVTGMRVRSHFAEEGLSTSQIELIANGIDADIAKRGWKVIRGQVLRASSDVDEAQLREAVRAEVHGPRPGQKSVDRAPAIDFDARSLIAVHMARDGGRGDSLESSGCVLVTSNTRLVALANRFPGLRAGGYDIAMSIGRFMNLMWLRSPAELTEISLARLTMECAALLRPSPEVWVKYARIVAELEAKGGVTAEEAANTLYSRESASELALAAARGVPIDYKLVQSQLRQRRRRQQAADAESSRLQQELEAQKVIHQKQLDEVSGELDVERRGARRVARRLALVTKVVSWSVVGPLWLGLAGCAAFVAINEAGRFALVAGVVAAALSAAGTWIAARPLADSMSSLIERKLVG